MEEKNLENLAPKEKELWAMRHSAEHVLHQALLKLFPKVKPAMGPATREGFYIDFEYSGRIAEEDFPKIEKKMAEIVKQDLPIKKEILPVPEARKLFKDNSYKQEWIDEIEERREKASVYWTGKDFVDLCAGPHVSSTGKIGPFKLLSLAGAYWRGSEKNQMLTRIYGTAFPTKTELDNHLKQIALAKERDHRRLGKELGLFTFSDLVGAGLPLYTPKGALMRRLINEHVESLQAAQGYSQVWTPQINKAELFKISGHYDKYKESMFRVVSNYTDEEFYLKPMNCPQHTQIYASQSRSYRDLPLRFTDFGMLYRDEKPGELLGLARVRAFSQDDCHIFCREDQVDDEIDQTLAMTKEIMATYGFRYRYRLSTRGPNHQEKYLGDPKIWDKVEKWAEKIMVRNRIDHFTAPGEAAFYAPKMDLLATDSLGREWQLSTVQIDYVMPARFKLTYTDKDGKDKTPVMIHRAIVGSPERFLMVLIEHFGGSFPVWLSPTQAVIIPISEKFVSYAKEVSEKLKEEGVRVELDDRGEKMQAKIRDAQLQKVPYMLIVGEREEKAGSVSVRLRDEKDLGEKKLGEVVHKIREVSKARVLNLW